MKDYSQYGEQAIITEFFKGRTGHFVDFGANDGVTLSNTYALVLSGWTGHYIEASPAALERLRGNVLGFGEQVYILPYAVVGRQQTGRQIMLHESDAHGGDNVALLSSVLESETHRWRRGQKFRPVFVDALDVPGLMSHGLRLGEFVTIDVEGMDWEVLRQLDLSGVELLCIEYNGNARTKAKIQGYVNLYSRAGVPFRLLLDNGTNLIWGRG